MRFYRPELDGLRFLAFLAVFAHHALPNKASQWVALGMPDSIAGLAASVVVAGAHGVDLFFALSAFLITELLLREHDRFGAIDFGKFFVRRALRIWPLYFAFVGFAAAGAPPLIPKQSLTGQQLAAFLLFVGNLETAVNGYPSSVLAPLWSVAIEEQFYLAWPLLLVWLGVSRMRRTLALALVVTISARTALVLIESQHPRIWCDSLARLDPFIAGAALALLLRRWRGPAVTIWVGRAVLAAAAGAIVLVTAFVPVNTRVAALGHVWSYSVIAIASAATVGAVMAARTGADRLLPVFSRTHAPRKLLTLSPLVRLGRVSYGLYVFHVFGLAAASELAPPSGPLRWGTIIVGGFAITVACALLSYRYLERPFLLLKERFSRVASRPV